MRAQPTVRRICVSPCSAACECAAAAACTVLHHSRQVVTNTVSQCSLSAGVQLQGVLDELYFYEGSLGARPASGGWQITLWAPTAQSISLQLFPGPRGGEAETVRMQRGEHGEWAAQVRSNIFKHKGHTKATLSF